MPENISLSLSGPVLNAMRRPSLAQQGEGINKRLRFRRPRPQLTDIDNPEGVEAGPPIPLRRVPAGKNKQMSMKVHSVFATTLPDLNL